MKITSMSLLVLLISTSGCGLFKVREKNEQAVSKIKKTALVAFAVSQPASSKVSLNLSKGGKAEASEGGSMISKSSEHIDQMYADMAAQLSKDLGWQVLDRKAMTSHPAYAAAFEKTMKGWQNKMAPNPGTQKFLVSEVMDFDSARILGAEGRTALAKALGVDSIVVAQVDVQLNGTTVMGIGSRYPQARLSFQVYSPEQENAVWFDGGIEGDEVKESVGTTAFFDEETLHRLTVKSASSAFRKIATVSKN